MIFSIKDYDNVLKDLIEQLKNNGIQLSKNNDDGRVNSIQNEEEVIEILKKIYKDIPIFKKYDIFLEKQPKPRYWYDIVIRNNDNTFYCPINIKISNFSNSSADNISSKEGLYFSLTGKIEEKCPNTWGQFFYKLSKDTKPNDTDYFFIVINKNDINDIIFNSMKRLKLLTPNGNNLPFQCKWSENRNIVNRTFEESKDFLLKTLRFSVIKRAQILKEFEEAFKNN